MGRRIERVLCRRWRDGTFERHPDELAVEEPLAIELDGVLVTTTMRTPGHDFELAVGFCHGEGLLGSATVLNCRFCGNGPALESNFNTVTVDTGGQAPRPTPRLGLTTSSCGLCGSASLDDLAERVGRALPEYPAMAFDPTVLAAMPDALRPLQELFSRTGAVHAAGAFDSAGTIDIVREDVGRHNAVDKVVGRYLLDGRLPARGHGLALSGRVSFEIVQKAWAGGFSALVAVSAPTSLAVAAAQRAGITLAGFARDGKLNLYAGPQF